MKATNIRSGIDGVANKGRTFAREAGAKLTLAAGAAADALSQVGPTAFEGGHRFRETVARVGDVAQELVSDVIHSANPTIDSRISSVATSSRASGNRSAKTPRPMKWSG